jgi:leucyl-tRNA synthetase
MICVNELTDLKCHKREILEPLATILAPFAPHLSEELWHSLGHDTTVCDAEWPEWKEKLILESTVTYPVSFNGKMRFKIDLPADMDNKAIEEAVLAHDQAKKWIGDKKVRKVIVVPKKIVNVVIG